MLTRRVRRLAVLMIVFAAVATTLGYFRTHELFFKEDEAAVEREAKYKDEEKYRDQLQTLHELKYGGARTELEKDQSLDPAIRDVNNWLMRRSLDFEKLNLATKNGLAFDSKRLHELHNTLNSVFAIMDEARPSVRQLDRYKGSARIYHAGFDTKVSRKDPVFTEKYLKQFLGLGAEEVEAMKKSHGHAVSHLPGSFPEGTFKGKGVVYVGGGEFNWLVLLSIKTLRYLGSELPVEVVIPTVEEYELDLCGRVFPALGAKCVLLPHVLGRQAIENFKFSGYQLKALALLACSFEDVLLLDSDNIPAMKPEYIFEAEPFTSKGLICWPDFWKRATSPLFYEIAGIQVSEKRGRFGYNKYGIYESGIINEKTSKVSEIPLHDREGSIPDPTTESGQLLISKRTHAKTLLLALYYNIYGPSHYYPLFSQGSDGEGDKETFLAAAVVLNNPYYQVNKFLNAFGHFDADRNFMGCGMGQYDPVEDNEILLHNVKLIKDSKFKSFEEAQGRGLELINKEPQILFIHSNFPKLNPMGLKKKEVLFDENGKRIRLYGEGMRKKVGYDFELVQWNSMSYLMCDLKIEVETFKGTSRHDICKEIKQQLNFLTDSVKSMD